MPNILHRIGIKAPLDDAYNAFATRDGLVLFTHAGWAEPIEFMHHCSTKWAVFLLSAKALVEKGKGSPEPHDIKIDNWN